MNFENDDQMIDWSACYERLIRQWLWDMHYKSITDLNPAIQALNEDKLGSSATQQTKEELLAGSEILQGINYFVL